MVNIANTTLFNWIEGGPLTYQEKSNGLEIYETRELRDGYSNVDISGEYKRVRESDSERC